MSITNEEIDATRATLRDTVTEALLGSISEGRLNVAEWEAALDALVEFERAAAQAELPCAEVNCYVESHPEMYAGNPHRICEAHEARQLLRAIIDKVKGEA